MNRFLHRPQSLWQITLIVLLAIWILTLVILIYRGPRLPPWPAGAANTPISGAIVGGGGAQHLDLT